MNLKQTFRQCVDFGRCPAEDKVMPPVDIATVIKFQPLGDRVVIKKSPADELTAGGIVLPDTAKEKPLKGEVKAVGAGRVDEHGNRITPDLRPGDTVIFGPYSGTEIILEGEEYTVMSEKDVFGVVLK
jgi:chaperonin GroES